MLKFPKSLSCPEPPCPKPPVIKRSSSPLRSIKGYIENRKQNKKNEKDAARLVLFEDYYKKKKMEVRDTATVQEQDKTRRVEMGAK